MNLKLPKLLLPLVAGGAVIQPLCAQSPAVPNVLETVKESVLSAPKLGALSDKLGFAASLPKDTEGYFSVLGAADLYERLKKTDLGQLLIEASGGPEGELAEMEADDDFKLLKSIVGEEVFVSFGSSSAYQYLHLANLSKAGNQAQMRMMVEMAAAAIGGEEVELPVFAQGPLGSLVSSPEGLIAFLESSEMPPILAGFKMSDADQRKMVFETLLGGLKKLQEDEGFEGEVVELTKDGLELKGVKFVGEKLAGQLTENEEVDSYFDSVAKKKDLLDAVKKRDLFCVGGERGDYLFFYVGGSLDGLKFAKGKEDSLLANGELDFLEAYQDKDVRILSFGEGAAMKKLSENGESVASILEGLKEGLAATDVFGDTRDIQALLSYTQKLEGSLFDMQEVGRFGFVGFLEEGFKIESQYTGNFISVDSETPHSFSVLGENDDLLLFSNDRTNPEFTSKFAEIIDSLGEATYLMSKRVAELDSDLVADYKQGFLMFDGMIAGELNEIWEALTKSWAQGTGDEDVFLVDTKGTFPKIPGVPGPIIEQGRLPRMAYLSPIADREALGASWTRTENAITKLLKLVEMMGGVPIPMQEIDENQKDGVTYYSHAIPFSTRDARPVVGLSEKNFFLSTSQNLIEDLNRQLAKGEGPKRVGNYNRLNFDAARDLANAWLQLFKTNAAVVIPDEDKRAEFEQNLPMLEKAIKAFEQLDELTTHCRVEEGEARTSLHFKMR